MREIHCDRGDYNAPIYPASGQPYPHGIPERLVEQCISDHEMAHKGHKCEVRERPEPRRRRRED